MSNKILRPTADLELSRSRCC